MQLHRVAVGAQDQLDGVDDGAIEVEQEGGEAGGIADKLALRSYDCSVHKVRTIVILSVVLLGAIVALYYGLQWFGASCATSPTSPT